MNLLEQILWKLECRADWVVLKVQLCIHQNFLLMQRSLRFKWQNLWSLRILSFICYITPHLLLIINIRKKFDECDDLTSHSIPVLIFMKDVHKYSNKLIDINNGLFVKFESCFYGKKITRSETSDEFVHFCLLVLWFKRYINTSESESLLHLIITDCLNITDIWINKLYHGIMIPYTMAVRYWILMYSKWLIEWLVFPKIVQSRGYLKY